MGTANSPSPTGTTLSSTVGTTCSCCGGAVKIIASIEDPLVIKKILDHLDTKSGA